jgi:DNA polymerase IV
MDRAIIHLNVADFAVAVERVVEARLRNRPVIVAPLGAARAMVYDMSEEAYRAGVRKRMPLSQAMRCCRDACVRPPRLDRYRRAMRLLLGKAVPFSPLIEPGDCDGHLFMDATGTSRLFGPPVDVAWRMHRGIKADLGLDPIWSLAPNKLLAKVATRVVKPIGAYVVGAGEEADFLAPLPVYLLPGIEREDLLRLRDFHLSRVCQVRALRFEDLQVPFGRRASHIYDIVRGVDGSPVRPYGGTPLSLMQEHTFPDDAHDLDLVESVLYRLVENMGAVLRRCRRVARRIRVLVDYPDGIRCVRRAACGPGTADDADLFARARSVMKQAWARRVRIRYLQVTCDRLACPPRQRELFAFEREESERRARLVATLDGIRERFGTGAVRVGRTLTA